MLGTALGQGSNNISGQGVIVTIKASVTFPVPVPLTSFADDADAFDNESIDMGDGAMGVNGNLNVWSKAVPLPLTLNVSPNTPDDIILETLLRANTVSRGKTTARDIITIVAVFPDLRTVIYNNGYMTKGMIANSVGQEHRLKTKSYSFIFESRSGI